MHRPEPGALCRLTTQPTLAKIGKASSSHTLKSVIVRKEWRYARQQGVCVYPIKGSPGIDFNSLPRWMRDAHFMIENLPEDFVERPGEFDQLLNLLLDEKREEPVAITAALRGAYFLQLIQ